MHEIHNEFRSSRDKRYFAHPNTCALFEDEYELIESEKDAISGKSANRNWGQHQRGREGVICFGILKESVIAVTRGSFG
jgi:hypothetical protein